MCNIIPVNQSNRWTKKTTKPFISTSFTIHHQQQIGRANAAIINYTNVHMVTDEMERARYLKPELHTEEMFVALPRTREQNNTTINHALQHLMQIEHAKIKCPQPRLLY
jgi:hypothetical protein